MIFHRVLSYIRSLGWKWKTKRNHCFIIILTIKIIPPSSFSSKKSSSPKSSSSSLQFPPSSLDTYIDTLSARLVTLPALGWPIAGATGTYQGRVSKQFGRFFLWFGFGDDSWKMSKIRCQKGDFYPWFFPWLRDVVSQTWNREKYIKYLFNQWIRTGQAGEFTTNWKHAYTSVIFCI